MGGELVSEQFRQRHTLDAQGNTEPGEDPLAAATPPQVQGSSSSLPPARRGLARWLSLWRSP